MKPYGVADIEADLRAAIDAGDEAEIGRLGALLDHQPTKATPSLHSAALYYASVGLRVFPLQPGAKVPFKGSSGCKDATSDPEQVTRWWMMFPNANIGIATGHLVDVIDVDGPAGVVAFVEHVEAVRSVALGMVSTPRAGGQHWYIPHVEGRGNKAGLIPHVDTRGHGGYVCAPPSVTDVGTYQWIRPLELPAA